MNAMAQLCPPQVTHRRSKPKASVEQQDLSKVFRLGGLCPHECISVDINGVV